MTTCDIALSSPRPLAGALEALLPTERERLLLGLTGKLQRSLCAADQNLGHLEEQLLRGSQELFRQILEKAAQQKADAAPPLCTLGRQAQQPGQRAQEQRRQLDQQMSIPEGRVLQDRDLQLPLALQPFALVIQLDAWNIGERDDWGHYSLYTMDNNPLSECWHCERRPLTEENDGW